MKKISQLLFDNYYTYTFAVLAVMIIHGGNLQAQCDQNCSGTNTFFGEFAGSSNTSGSLNTAVGWTAGGLITTGFGNSFLGHTAGIFIKGSTNSFIGLGAGQRISSGSNNICIGSLSGPTSDNDTISNRLYIDVEEDDDPLIYGEFDNDFVKINGILEVTAGLSNPSSVKLKENFASLTPFLILNKLSELNIMEWSYKSYPDVRHLGPTAEDFHDAFGLSANDRTISTIDADGVALIAIQALNEKVKENTQLLQRIDAYEEKNKELQARLLKLEKLLDTE